MTKPINRILSLLLLCALAGTVNARPASWHWWTSKIDGARICLQTPPGEGWTYSSGPYRDAHCTLPARY